MLPPYVAGSDPCICEPYKQMEVFCWCWRRPARRASAEPAFVPATPAATLPSPQLRTSNKTSSHLIQSSSISDRRIPPSTFPFPAACPHKLASSPPSESFPETAFEESRSRHRNSSTMPQPTKNTPQDVEMRDTIPKDAERAAAGVSGDAGEKKDDEQKEEDPVVAAVNGMLSFSTPATSAPIAGQQILTQTRHCRNQREPGSTRACGYIVRCPIYITSPTVHLVAPPKDYPRDHRPSS